MPLESFEMDQEDNDQIPFCFRKSLAGIWAAVESLPDERTLVPGECDDYWGCCVPDIVKERVESSVQATVASLVRMLWYVGKAAQKEKKREGNQGSLEYSNNFFRSTRMP